MTKPRLSIFIALIPLIAGIMFCALPAQAVTLVPPSLEFSDVQPGVTIPSKIKLFNETAGPLTLYSQTANFSALDETGTPKVNLEKTQGDLASWISIESGPFTLAPGERIEIPFTIVLPADAPPGGHYASLLFSPQPPESIQQGQLAIDQKIGMLILVSVRGTMNEAGSILDLTADGGKTLFTRLPVIFSLRFKNSGNIHLRPTGNLTIRNMLGGTTVVIPINTDTGATLPQSVRRYDAVWENANNAGARGNFFQEVGREWKNFAFGPYTASVSLVFGQTNEKTVATTLRLWLFPWHLLLIWLIGIAVVVFIIIVFVRRYNHWIITRSNQPPKQK
ncbi:MAG: hypothetical protein V1778_05120 [bacterium]